MEARLIGFGEVEIEGERYTHDLLIDRGVVGKRHKKPSKAHREDYGHTPLSLDEPIPWHGKTLYVGTGTYGSLPIMPAVYEEASRRGIEIVALPTAELCQRLARLKPREINAIVHVTC